MNRYSIGLFVLAAFGLLAAGFYLAKNQGFEMFLFLILGITDLIIALGLNE